VTHLKSVLRDMPNIRINKTALAPSGLFCLSAITTRMTPAQ
jgi:hypothetical protein